MAELVPLTDRPPGAILFRLPDRMVTAAEFAADVQHLAATLPEATHVVNLCNARYAFAVGFAAALLRGQVSLLTHERAPDRVASLAQRFGGSYAVTDGAGTPGLPCVSVPAPGLDAPSRDVTSLGARPADQPAVIVFTSGSTGEPMAHAKSWGSLVERSRDAGIAFGLDAGAPVTVVATVPPQHMYGFETTVLLPLHAPAAAWCGAPFYPADVRAALAASSAPRILVTTPLQLRALLAAGAMPAIARVISATAPLDPAMAAAAERQWGTVVSEIFGATEVGSIASRRTTAGAEWTPYPQIRLAPAPEGVLVRAPGAADVVLDDEVTLLPDGRFRLVGRRSDVVKLGGRRASLSGLNRALASVAGVEDCAFVPPADDDDRGAGARMTAFVVAPGQAVEAILAALRGQIDPVFLPRRIVHVDRLPRNAMGKLPAAALLALQDVT